MANRHSQTSLCRNVYVIKTHCFSSFGLHPGQRFWLDKKARPCAGDLVEIEAGNRRTLAIYQCPQKPFAYAWLADGQSLRASLFTVGGIVRLEGEASKRGQRIIASARQALKKRSREIPGMLYSLWELLFWFD